jgi:hypothetical protein
MPPIILILKTLGASSVPKRSRLSKITLKKCLKMKRLRAATAVVNSSNDRRTLRLFERTLFRPQADAKLGGRSGPTEVLQQTFAHITRRYPNRVIGVEVFGRSPSYDTGTDAILCHHRIYSKSRSKWTGSPFSGRKRRRNGGCRTACCGFTSFSLDFEEM